MIGQPTTQQEMAMAPAEDGFVAGLDAPQLTDLIQQVSEDELQILQARKEQALQELQAANDEAQEILRNAKEQAKQEREAAFAQGKKEGLEAGRKEAQDEQRRERALFEQEKEKWREQWVQEMDTFEPRFVDTISDLYETVFHMDTKAHRDILLHLISNTLRRGGSTGELIVRVSSDDYPFISLHRKDLIACVVGENTTVTITEDRALHKNACLIETDGGIFDCGVDTQLAELRAKLKLLSYQKHST
jgi:flagellar assembly protein FliH